MKESGTVFTHQQSPLLFQRPPQPDNRKEACEVRRTQLRVAFVERLPVAAIRPLAEADFRLCRPLNCHL